MDIITDRTFDEERALYESRGITLRNSRFEGPADGESALKESGDITVQSCYFNLRYPFWHDKGVKINDSELTENCRAALWYSEDIEIENSRLHGIKALRECRNIRIKDCDIISSEFGWSAKNIKMENTRAQSEYFMMRSENIDFRDVDFKGKYSFQYTNNAVFENCVFDTKDAFWHGRNITVRNSVIKGEYLGWYSEGLTLINCKISGTQPFCYCRGLRLIDCEMTDSDLAFEKSCVEATLTAKIDSIKNPLAGYICVPEFGELIMDDENAKCKVIAGRKAICNCRTCA